MSSMAVAAGRAAPSVLVDCDWLVAHLDDPDVVRLEVDEQPLIYRIGHMPGAHGLDWHTDLQDPVARDIPDAAAIRRLWRRCGIERDSTVVIYGDKNNWYACFAYWLFKMYGLENMRLLDGGRPLWISRGLPMTQEEPLPLAVDPPEPDLNPRWRAGWQDVVELTTGTGGVLIDVRSQEEYRGELLTEPGYPEEVAQRPGHIPGGLNIPWARATQVDGRFKPIDELYTLYGAQGVRADRPVISYCRIGERSAHTWFVLHELLGHENVRNYDGSWTEWGSMVGMPVALGAEIGEPSPDVPSPVGLR